MSLPYGDFEQTATPPPRPPAREDATKGNQGRVVPAHARVKPEVFVVKLMVLAILTAAASGGIATSRGPAKLICQALLGVLFAHAVELAHQCLHKTATGRGRVDHALGVALCCPALVSFWSYLYIHLWHHRFNGTDRDRESFSYSYNLMESPRRVIRLLGLAWHLSQFAHYINAARRMASAIAGRLEARLRANDPPLPAMIAGRVERDYRIMAGLLALGAVLSLASGTPLLLDFWLIPLLLGYGPAHALIELPEHFGCDKPGDDVRANTRSIRAGRFACWLTNFNNLHVPHHHAPTVPMEALPALQALLEARGGMKFLESSYPAYYRDLLVFLWTGRRRRP